MNIKEKIINILTEVTEGKTSEKKIRVSKNEIIERIKEIDDKYIESSRKRFSILPGSLQKSLYEMLCLLKEHEINYDDLNMNN